MRADVRGKSDKASMVPTYDLECLLHRMTANTFHDIVDFGVPVGGERWPNGGEPDAISICR